MTGPTEGLDAALALRGFYNLGRTKPPVDDDHVSLNSPAEVEYWTRIFGVTERGLRDAVDRVGHEFDAVRRELGGR